MNYKSLFSINIITLILTFGVFQKVSAQIQPSDYPYSNPEWTYLQKWVNYLVTPPVTSYSFLTCKAYGDTIGYGKEFMKVGTVPIFGPNAYNYYHKSNDSLFDNIFASFDSTNYLQADYTSVVGDVFNDNNDTVRAIWNNFLLDGSGKKFYRVERFYGGVFDTVIEDIGSIHEPWFDIGYTGSVPTTTLICFKNGTEVLYYVPLNFTHGSMTYTNPCASLVTSVASVNSTTDPFISASFSNNELHIQNLSEEKNLTLDLLDLQGRRIERKQIINKTESFSFLNITPGIYFYSIYNSQRCYNGKILIVLN